MDWLSVLLHQFTIFSRKENTMDRGIIRLRNLMGNIKEFMSRKEEGVKAIIVEIILIVVAAAVCILFKDQIMSLLSDLLTEISDRVKGVFN